MASSNFLKDIQGSRTLNDITVPGSHDAGVYEDAAEAAAFGGKSYAVCQTGDLGVQCRDGSRFFDIRLNDEGVAHHKTGPVGAVGGEIGQMMRDVGSFLVNNPTEFVILRFSKCKGHKSIVDTLKTRFGHVLYKGEGNIATKQLDQVRGKIIAVFNDKEFSDYISPKDGIHPFGKFKGTAAGTTGLITCGTHTGEVSMKKVFKKQVAMVHEHDKHKDDEHLSVLYWTQTAGVFATARNIKGFTTGTSGTHSKTSDLMTLLKQEVDDFKNTEHGVNGLPFINDKLKRMRMAVPHPKFPNVVMYDFVNAATSDQIIELNNPALRL